MASSPNGASLPPNPPGQNFSAVPLQHPWVYRARPAQIVAVSTLAGIALWLFVASMDLLWVKYNGLALAPMLTVDVLAGMAFSALLLRLLWSQRVCHRRIVERLVIIGDMNHYVRNALERIELAAHARQDAGLMAEVRAAAAQIQWALAEVLPRDQRSSPP